MHLSSTASGTIIESRAKTLKIPSFGERGESTAKTAHLATSQ